MMAFAAMLLGATAAQAAEVLIMPYILGASAGSDLASATEKTRKALEGAGFEIAGAYTPYAGAHVMAITSDAQKQWAAKSENGGYGAVIRVSVTEIDGGVEVAYNNPVWVENIYRMEPGGKALADKLAAAIGAQKGFGSYDGLDVDRVRRYQYMMFMPNFTDQETLADHGDHAAAVAAVEKGLASGAGGTSKVFRVDVTPDQTLFGVGLSSGDGGDEKIMNIIDKGSPAHTAHLPMEVLVNGGKVLALHGKFRIAQSFPELGMGTFMEISSAPDAILDSLRAMAK
ncbi:hypothetical protein MAIT1_00472 [Magnetofaba australis IT-1]|uniref:Uncharacterized protein n=1 Tax=Magnetofaba australis IT-1 TaxID=1434232 RepID=A0A1Y2JYU3_9PROT|nr:hypothetical protein MAIT1_00472 [Magnetofaba australis IT-1]